MTATMERSLTNEEQEMFLEIGEVMKRRSGTTRRFNLALDHQHFPIAEDEVLCEANDPENRVLKSVVLKKDAVPVGSLVSQWSIKESGITPVQFCWAIGCK